MADPEHLAILERGVEEWNRWRQSKYDGTSRSLVARIRPDLRNWDGQFLRQFDFFDRFVQEYFPHPGETRELYEDYTAGRLSEELQRYGWRTLNDANLNWTDLTQSNLSGLHLRHARLFQADLSEANLESANLTGADLREAKLVGARLSSSDLTDADLTGADLSGSELVGAVLRRANLTKATLHRADLSRANLERATLVETVLGRANLSGCRVYGLSVWNLHSEDATQNELVITAENEPAITVDNLEVAQFVYLLLNNERVRQIIDTITAKVVLILGRFVPERKTVLDMLRAELRNRNYLPILFDFEAPRQRDLTETVSTLTHMSRFVIADLTDARSIPQELQRIIPDLPSVPVQPIMLASQGEYAMFEHFRRYPWVLEPLVYTDAIELRSELAAKVIQTAEAKARELTR
jgi:uncharacterized protein YjbI with pentapeptide repeats